MLPRSPANPPAGHNKNETELRRGWKFRIHAGSSEQPGAPTAGRQARKHRSGAAGPLGCVPPASRALSVQRSAASWPGVEVVVDVGFGAAPDTLLALATRLLAGRPTLCIVGTETDAERLASAQPLCGSFGSSLQLRRGDCDGWFVLPLRDDERRPSFVRCMNVLRDYHPDQVGCGSLALAAGVQLHCIAGCWLTRAMLRFAC